MNKQSHLFLPEKSAHELATPKETAEALRVKEQTLATWRCTGRVKIPYLKIGRSVRYPIGACREALRSMTVEGDDNHAG